MWSPWTIQFDCLLMRDLWPTDTTGFQCRCGQPKSQCGLVVL